MSPIPSDFERREKQDPEAFESSHWMAYRIGDGNRIVVDLTGVVHVNLKGSTGWVRKTLRVDINGGKVRPLLDLRQPEPGKHWEIEPLMWSVSASPVSIYNGKVANNAGWALDTCNTQWDLGDPAEKGNLLSTISLYLDVATSDTDGYLYRVNYDFRAVGHLHQV